MKNIFYYTFFWLINSSFFATIFKHRNWSSTWLSGSCSELIWNEDGVIIYSLKEHKTQAFLDYTIRKTEMTLVLSAILFFKLGNF